MSWFTRLFNTFFRDKAGRIVIFQVPNTALTTYLALVIIGWFLSDGYVRNAEHLLAFVALATWAVLEIISGASYFRRMLGLAVLAVAVSDIFMKSGLLHKFL